jgi:DNA-binding winged helix-turn-helix (wHTH) protein
VDIRFGPFTLDERARQLVRGRQPIHLSTKAFDLLVLLVSRRPEALSKDELQKELWPDTFVADVNLAVLVAEIRTALQEDARSPRFIRTVHRVGYAFSGAAVTVDRRPQSFLSDIGACWIVWRDERLPLNHGDNLVGRDPAADIRVDAVGVSRRHALIVVGDREVTIHDLGSKNGTYIAEDRLTSPISLTDGTEIRIGPVPLSFRQLAGVTSTQTVNLSRKSRSRS